MTQKYFFLLFVFSNVIQSAMKNRTQLKIYVLSRGVISPDANSFPEYMLNLLSLLKTVKGLKVQPNIDKKSGKKYFSWERNSLR